MIENMNTLQWTRERGECRGEAERHEERKKRKKAVTVSPVGYDTLDLFLLSPVEEATAASGFHPNIALLIHLAKFLWIDCGVKVSVKQMKETHETLLKKGQKRFASALAEIMAHSESSLESVKPQ